MRRLPDPELIALARSGSHEAAGVLFDRYWAHAWKSAYAVTADRALADDAAQEALARAFGSLDRFDETRPFGPWLKRIAVNRAIDHLRRSRRTTPIADVQDALHVFPPGTGSDERSEDLEPRAVSEAVAALAEGKRLVVVLHYWLDLPLDEIAGILGIPVGTVASRLARAKSELRSVLEGERV